MEKKDKKVKGVLEYVGLTEWKRRMAKYIWEHVHSVCVRALFQYSA